jgi:hypothetical protein
MARSKHGQQLGKGFRVRWNEAGNQTEPARSPLKAISNEEMRHLEEIKTELAERYMLAEEAAAAEAARVAERVAEAARVAEEVNLAMKAKRAKKQRDRRHAKAAAKRDGLQN